MHPSSVSPLPRHDKIAVLFSLGGVTLLAWTYLIDMAVRMNDMSVMSMPSATEILTIRVWSGRDFVVMFLMWTVMMIGMMVPTAVPTTLVYAAVARKAKAQHHRIAPTSVFIVGYVAAWTLFSLGATAAQWALDQAALLPPMMVTTSPTVGATLLLAAGIYQLTPLKHACLTHCRGPLHFLVQHWRPGPVGALQMGFKHGLFCLGCCWILMGLLFLGGVMNLLWIATITLFVLLEKIIPLGPEAGRVAGIAMIVVSLVIFTGIH